METTYNDAATLEPVQPKRPDFLKVLCILSFIACGLMILLYAIGTMCLALDADAVAGVWDKVIANNKNLEDMDPVEFFHKVGMVSFYGLIANIVSLVGVIFMWRLEKIGFYIYVVAELSVNFFSLDMGEQSKSYGGLIFSVFIDLAFIVMYAMNLKYMNKKGAPAVSN